MFWEFNPSNPNYQTGVRFDARFRDGSRPEQFGFNWMHQFNLSNGWGARALLLTSVEFGSNRRSGVNLQSRARITRRLGDGPLIGLELFNNYGNTGDIGSLSDQTHTLGPMLSHSINNRTSLYAGAQVGLTNPSADLTLRFWLTRRL